MVVLVVFAIPRLRLTTKIARTSMTDAPVTKPPADAKTGLTGSGNIAENHADFVISTLSMFIRVNLYVPRFIFYLSPVLL